MSAENYHCCMKIRGSLIWEVASAASYLGVKQVQAEYPCFFFFSFFHPLDKISAKGAWFSISVPTTTISALAKVRLYDGISIYLCCCFLPHGLLVLSSRAISVPSLTTCRLRCVPAGESHHDRFPPHEPGSIASSPSNRPQARAINVAFSQPILVVWGYSTYNPRVPTSISLPDPEFRHNLFETHAALVSDQTHQTGANVAELVVVV